MAPYRELNGVWHGRAGARSLNQLRAWALMALLPVLLAGCGEQASGTAPRPAVAASPHPTSATASALASLPLPPLGLRATDVPTVVATVDGLPVASWLYLSQVNFHLALAEGLLSPGQPVRAVSVAQRLAIEQQALSAVIDNAILVAYGQAHGWAPSQRRVADNARRVIQRRGGSAASRVQVAREYLTPAQDRIVARDTLLTEQVLDHFIAGLRQPVMAVSYRMIVTATRPEASRVRALLAQSGQWVDLAARYSIDPPGRGAGGEQPILGRGAGDARLEAVVFGLPPDTLGQPVRLAGGWAIVEVLRRLPAPNIYTADRARYLAWLSGLRRQARITSYIRLPRG